MFQAHPRDVTPRDEKLFSLQQPLTLHHTVSLQLLTDPLSSLCSSKVLQASRMVQRRLGLLPSLPFLPSPPQTATIQTVFRRMHEGNREDALVLRIQYDLPSHIGVEHNSTQVTLDVEVIWAEYYDYAEDRADQLSISSSSSAGSSTPQPPEQRPGQPPAQPAAQRLQRLIAQAPWRRPAQPPAQPAAQPAAQPPAQWPAVPQTRRVAQRVVTYSPSYSPFLYPRDLGVYS